jgi:hypothetical protein
MGERYLDKDGQPAITRRLATSGAPPSAEKRLQALEQQLCPYQETLSPLSFQVDSGNHSVVLARCTNFFADASKLIGEHADDAT